MALTRWTNRSLPQTLQIGMILLYIDAVFGVLFGLIAFFPIGTVLVLGAAAGGLGIANEKRWGWTIGVAVSVVTVGFYLYFFSASILISLMFAVAQLALLVHPQSRDHQKVWFT